MVVVATAQVAASRNAGFAQENIAGVGYGHGSGDHRVQRDWVSCPSTWWRNYDPLAVEDDGTCEYTTCEGCVDDFFATTTTATISDADQCDYYTCLGCTDEEACNGRDRHHRRRRLHLPDGRPRLRRQLLRGHGRRRAPDGEDVLGYTYHGDQLNPFATEENGGVFDGVTVCLNASTRPRATSTEANSDDGSLAEEGYDCSGVCLFDSDNDGICNQFEGCTNTLACNYDPQALDNDGTCVFRRWACTTRRRVLVDSDGDGVSTTSSSLAARTSRTCNYYDAATATTGRVSTSSTGTTARLLPGRRRQRQCAT